MNLSSIKFYGSSGNSASNGAFSRAYTDMGPHGYSSGYIQLCWVILGHVDPVDLSSIDL